jgi:hypothetical protein
VGIVWVTDGEAVAVEVSGLKTVVE